MHTRRVTGIARMAISATLATSLMFLPACSTTTPVRQMDGVTAADTSRSSSSAEYAALLFDDSRVHEIDIEMDDGDWDDLLEHPSDKTKYEASVTIDGETIDKVSFATKGNSSLTSVASDEDSDRYGFKLTAPHA